MTDPIRGLFGRLPAIPDKRRLLIGPATWVVEPPLPVIDHLSAVPLEMDGNDQWGNCVVVAVKNHFVTTWMVLRPGESAPLITAQDCIDAYKKASGATKAPGPGLITELFLDWVIAHGLTTDPRTKPLAWGSVQHTLIPIEQVNSEFVAGIYGVVIYDEQEYPSSLWTQTKINLRGYHEIAGGSHDPTYVDAATWAYITRMTKGFVDDPACLNEHHVIIWPHVWEALSPERKAHIANDYQALTGRQFPAIPDPVVPYVPRTAMSTVSIQPQRIVDNRGGTYKHVEVIVGPLPPNSDTKIPMAGVGRIPANAVAVDGNVTAVAPTVNGWLAVGPTVFDPNDPFSSLNWTGGQMPVANGFHSGLDTGGSLNAHNGSKGSVYIIFDVTAADVP